MKTFLKMLLGLLIGAFIGLLLAGIGIVCFTDTTVSQFIDNFSHLDLPGTLCAVLVVFAAMVAAVVVLIPLHEMGHLVCGLLTGYRFVSFRVFNFTLIKVGGRMRIKKFAVAGTGGQCLLTPPDRVFGSIPFFWYNAGGVLANVLVLIPVVWGTLAVDDVFVGEFLWIVALLMILVNGIPMSASGVGNDAANLLLLRRSMLSRRGMMLQLRANGLIQNGVRPRDMPAEWADVPGEIDYSNALELWMPMYGASRLVDLEQYAAALREFENLYSHRDSIMPLYRREIECELIYLYLVTGDTERAAGLWTDELRKYVMRYRRVMSSKERLMFAVAMYLDNDPAVARRIYDDLSARADTYLLQGEVKSDLALMSSMLDR